MPHKYAEMFQKLLWDNCRTLLSSGWKRDCNLGAPFAFGENHLRKHAKSAIENGSYVTPAVWPEIVVEEKVEGDRTEVGHRHGPVDYFFRPRGLDRKFSLPDLLATCEVGGPTRPALLHGSQANWYPKIVKDIEKQLWRARYAGAVQHFVSVFVRNRSNSDVRMDFVAVRRTMFAQITHAQLGDTVWSHQSDIPGLYLATFSVTRRVYRLNE